MAERREQFGGRLSAIMAFAGSAIGLGNLWRFPYIVGENGGAAFVIVYIAATLLFSLPVFVAEVAIGRRSSTSAFGAMGKLSGGSRFWKGTGMLAVLIPLVILSYYSVIGGWSVDFFVRACSLEFLNADAEAVTGIFGHFIQGTAGPIAAHLLFLAACCAVVAFGVKAGIERFSKVTIPVLFVLVVIIAVYSISLPGAGAGVRYILKPDFSALTPRSLAYALGQSFYSLSLGMGIIITYGSYVSKDEDILTMSCGTAVSDLLFAVLAAFAIMPAVFSAGIAPESGPGLIFQSLPYIFSQMGRDMPVASTVISALFFLTVIVAAMTSCISLIEVGVSYLCDRHGMRRPLASLAVFGLCGVVGVLCSLSFGPLSGCRIGGRILFDFFDWFSSNIMLLLMAFLVVVFAGFVMKRQDVRDELTNSGTLRRNDRVFPVVYFLIKWVAPAGVLLIFVSNFIL